MGMCMGSMQSKSNLHWIAGNVSLSSLMRSSGQECKLVKLLIGKIVSDAMEVELFMILIWQCNLKAQTCVENLSCYITDIVLLISGKSFNGHNSW